MREKELCDYRREEKSDKPSKGICRDRTSRWIVLSRVNHVAGNDGKGEARSGKKEWG